MYSIIYSEIAVKYLEKLEKSSQQRIIAVLERCRIRPLAYAKKLVGIPFYRLRAGDYRIIIDIQPATIIIFVIEIGHRKNVYK